MIPIAGVKTADPFLPSLKQCMESAVFPYPAMPQSPCMHEEPLIESRTNANA